jgi:hypothetical protein
MKPLNLKQYAATIAIAGLLLGGCSDTGSQFAAPSGTTQQQAASTLILSAFRGLKAEPDHAYNNYAYVACADCRCLWGCDTGCGSSSKKIRGDEWVLVSKDCGASKTATVYGVALLKGNSDSKTAYAGLSNDTVAVAKWKKDRYMKAGTLTGLTGDPIGIASDLKGNVWVTNWPSATISEFYPGARSPSQTYTDSNLASLSYIAIDRRDDIYVEGQSRASGGIEVDELQAAGTFTSITASGQLGYTAGGLAVIVNNGKTGYLFVNDQGTANGPPAITRWLLKGGKLVKDGSFKYSGIDTALSVDPSGTDTMHVWAANNVQSNSEFTTSGVEYAFPSGGVVLSTPTATSSFESFGIAVTEAP